MGLSFETFMISAILEPFKDDVKNFFEKL